MALSVAPFLANAKHTSQTDEEEKIQVVDEENTTNMQQSADLEREEDDVTLLAWEEPTEEEKKTFNDRYHRVFLREEQPKDNYEIVWFPVEYFAPEGLKSLFFPKTEDKEETASYILLPNSPSAVEASKDRSSRQKTSENIAMGGEDDNGQKQHTFHVVAAQIHNPAYDSESKEIHEV